MEESTLMRRKAPPGVEDSALVWMTAPCYGGKRPGMHEGSPV